MPVRTLITALLVILATPAVAAERGFALVEVSDMARSLDWYKRAFGLRVANQTSRPAFEHRVLIGDHLLLELAQSKPPLDAPPKRMLRIGKVGFQVADLDAAMKRIRAAGIEPSGGMFFDEAIDLATIQLRDPDGNIIQLFGKSAGPFSGRVKVSPDMKKGSD